MNPIVPRLNREANQVACRFASQRDAGRVLSMEHDDNDPADGYNPMEDWG